MTTLVERYGTWAVVAGASEGIGAAFARQLATAGFSLILIARRPEPLEALAVELRALGREVDTHAFDLGSPDLEGELVRIATRRPVGVVVWNAALSVMAPFLSAPVAEHQRMLDVNARGPLTAARVFGEPMVARGRGAPSIAAAPSYRASSTGSPSS